MPISNDDLDRLARRMTAASEYFRRHQDIFGKQLAAFGAIDDRTWRSMQEAARMATQPGMMAAMQDATRRWKQHEELLGLVGTRAFADMMRVQQAVDKARLMDVARQLSGPGLAWSAVLAEQRSSLTNLNHIYRGVTALDIPAMQKVVGQVGGLNSVMAGYHSRLAAINNSVLQVMPPRLAILATRPMVRLDELSGSLIAAAEDSGQDVALRSAAASIGAATIETAVVQRSAITVVEGLLPDVWSDDEVDGDLPPCNSADLVAREVQSIISQDSSQLENRDLYQELWTPRLTRIAASIVNGVRKCNALCSGDGKLFTYTDRSVEACLTLTQYFDVTPEAFCRIVRDLYVLLYEAAGADKLRFLQDAVVSSDEAEVVFDIKHFRNYYCDHDLEHGSQSDIRNKKRKLNELCTKYIGRPLPRSGDDFAAILIGLYRRVNAFLRLMYDRLEARTSSEMRQ